MEQKNSRKRLNSLILLVAFTAVMLIVSTYAWFSTQKNVTLKGIEGVVNVAEGLQISLDAKNWVNEIDLSATGIAEYFRQTNAEYNLQGTDVLNLKKPYATSWNEDTGAPEAFYFNTIPDELLPASTIGRDSIGQTDFTLYRGENESGVTLTNIDAIPKKDAENPEGYYAIDFFIQNSTASAFVKNYEDAITANNPTLAKTYEDDISLFTSSTVKLKETSKNTTGLQNTLRTAFVLFENDATDKIKVAKTPTQKMILEGTTGKNIKDVTIWEPNASGNGKLSTNQDVTTTGYPAHVDYVYQNNNRITFHADDLATYSGSITSYVDGDGATKHLFSTTGAIPTYALTAKSKDAKYTVTNTDDTAGIKDIYNWNITDLLPSGNVDKIDDKTGLAKQITVQTSTDGVTEETPLYSAKDGTTTFSLAPGQYHKLRLYIWLEGQDVDCINWASLGGNVLIDVGLSKKGTKS